MTLTLDAQLEQRIQREIELGHRRNAGEVIRRGVRSEISNASLGVPTPMKAFDTQPFIRELVEKVESLTKSAEALKIRGEYTRWTFAVKSWLAEEAENYGCHAIYTDRAGTSEFMLDLVWWQKEKPGCALLGCESEWGNLRDPRRNAARVAEDFDKLLSFKASIKLMIFEAERGCDIEADTIAELNRYLRDYSDHRTGEKYIVLNLCNEPAAWHFVIEKDGEAIGASLMPFEI